MNIKIPTLKDYEAINNLAIQVHELHVTWRPDLFNSVKNVITKDYNEISEDAKIFINDKYIAIMNCKNIKELRSFF